MKRETRKNGDRNLLTVGKRRAAPSATSRSDKESATTQVHEKDVAADRPKADNTDRCNHGIAKRKNPAKKVGLSNGEKREATRKRSERERTNMKKYNKEPDVPAPGQKASEEKKLK